jgi:hypothetical protein
LTGEHGEAGLKTVCRLRHESPSFRADNSTRKSIQFTRFSPLRSLTGSMAPQLQGGAKRTIITFSRPTRSRSGSRLLSSWLRGSRAEI